MDGRTWQEETRQLTLFSVSIAVANCFVDEGYTVAIRDSSVMGFGCEDGETELLKLGKIRGWKERRELTAGCIPQENPEACNASKMAKNRIG